MHFKGIRNYGLGVFVMLRCFMVLSEAIGNDVLEVGTAEKIL